MRIDSNKKFKFTSYEDLLGISDEADDRKITNLSLSQLHAFKDHPYKVLDNQDMNELVESIRANGILTPIVVRKKGEGEYEIISGHRRTHAAALAGMTTVPAVIHDCSDDEAAIAMVDLNIQRKNISHSEKAKAYKIKYDAMKHQGKRYGKDALEEMAEASGENKKKIQRYLRLTSLSEDLLRMIDEKKLGFSQGVDISFMSEQEQKWLFEILQKSGESITTYKSAKLKELSQNSELSKEQVEGLVYSYVSKPESVTIGKKELCRVLGRGYEKGFVEELIISLLEQWKSEQAEG